MWPKDMKLRKLIFREIILNFSILVFTSNPRTVYAASRKVAGSSPDEVDFFKLT
jgi:hypothetical protein